MEDAGAVDGEPRDRRFAGEAAERLERPPVEPPGPLQRNVEAVVGKHGKEAAGPPRLQRHAGDFAKDGELVDDAGASTGHSSTATMSFAPRRWKPRMTPRAVFTTEKIARRRLPRPIGTAGSISAAMPR